MAATTPRYQELLQTEEGTKTLQAELKGSQGFAEIELVDLGDDRNHLLVCWVAPYTGDYLVEDFLTGEIIHDGPLGTITAAKEILRRRQTKEGR